MRRPIKHVLNDAKLSQAGNAQYHITLVQGVTNADPYGAAQSQVNAGAAIVTHLSLSFTVWIDPQTVPCATSCFQDFNWYIWFNVAGAQTRPVSYSVGTNDLKNQVFVQGRGKLSGVMAATTNLIAGSEIIRNFDVEVNIPKWAQKINKDDVIEFVIDFTGDAAANHNVVVQGIFKEFEQS